MNKKNIILKEIPQLKILIVDDEEVILEELKNIILEDEEINIEKDIRNKITVLKALNGAQAIQILKSEKNVNLILLDIMMPIMDGYQVLNALRTDSHLKTYQDIPIFFISGTVKDTSDRIRGLELEADQVFGKPYDPQLLSNHIRKELKRQIKIYNKELEETKRRLILEANKVALKENTFYVVSSHTYSHSARVGILTNIIGDSPVLNLSKAEKNYLTEMVLEHDKGKIGIPENILNKPAKLTEKEMSIIQMHTIISSILLNSEYNEYLSPVVYGEFHHHENYSGCGYPCGIPLLQEHTHIWKEEPIRVNFLLSIINLADALDAITSRRPYKDSMKLSFTSQIFINDCFTHFNPKVVEAFFERLNEPEQKLLIRIDRNYTSDSLMQYYCFLKAVSILNRDEIFNDIIEYYKQDIPQNKKNKQKIEIRSYFLEEIINSFFTKSAIIKITNENISQDLKTKLINNFKNKFIDLMKKNKYNFFIIYYEFLEQGWSHRLLYLNDVEEIKEKTFEEIKKIDKINDRFKKILTIREAINLLFLLESYYYFNTTDIMNAGEEKKLQKEYDCIQQTRINLKRKFDSLKKCKISIIADIMILFQNKIQELIIQLKNSDLNRNSYDNFLIPKIEEIILELKIKFRNMIKK